MRRGRPTADDRAHRPHSDRAAGDSSRSLAARRRAALRRRSCRAARHHPGGDGLEGLSSLRVRGRRQGLRRAASRRRRCTSRNVYQAKSIRLRRLRAGIAVSTHVYDLRRRPAHAGHRRGRRCYWPDGSIVDGSRRGIDYADRLRRWRPPPDDPGRGGGDGFEGLPRSRGCDPTHEEHAADARMVRRPASIPTTSTSATSAWCSEVRRPAQGPAASHRSGRRGAKH